MKFSVASTITLLGSFLPLAFADGKVGAYCPKKGDKTCEHNGAHIECHSFLTSPLSIPPNQSTIEPSSKSSSLL